MKFHLPSMHCIFSFGFLNTFFASGFSLSYFFCLIQINRNGKKYLRKKWCIRRRVRSGLMANFWQSTQTHLAGKKSQTHTSKKKQFWTAKTNLICQILLNSHAFIWEKNPKIIHLSVWPINNDMVRFIDFHSSLRCCR